MPINGLSETVRLPRLGKIHLGHTEKQIITRNGKEIEIQRPVKDPFFVLPKDHPDYECLVKQFGKEPTELRVYIPVEDEEKWCEQYYKAYDRTHGLVCKGDGETALRMTDEKTGNLPTRETGTVTMKEIPCAGRECPAYKAKDCGEAMNLRFVLPDAPGIGIWQIDTGSKNSILNINSCARLIKMTFGRISMIPLKLTLEPIEVKNPENGKRQTVYVLNLRTSVTINQLADDARKGVHQLLIGQAELENAWDVEVEQDKNDLYGPAPTEEKKESVPVAATVVSEQPAVVVDDFDRLFPPEKTTSAPTPATQGQWFIDQQKLKEGLELLQWAGVLAWIKEHFKVTGKKVSEVVPLLTEAQQKELWAQVNTRLDMR